MIGTEKRTTWNVTPPVIVFNEREEPLNPYIEVPFQDVTAKTQLYSV